ncbi:MAG: DNA polymerase IV [Anaerofustis sp.]
MERVILHSDLNNFYASVECLNNPAIRGFPVAVGGSTELRHGIILAKNYIAKKYGIQTGEAIWQAKQKCPGLVVVRPNFSLYLKYSKLVKNIYADYTDKIESFGLDECWLDVTDSAIYGDGKSIADEIRKRITFELGITASVGVSFNKIFSKLGSDMKKPDATTVITKENYQELVWNLPVNDLLYVGRSTYTKFKQYGIHTIGDLANTDLKYLKKHLGKNGYTLWVFANGWDDSPVSNEHSEPYIKSIGFSTTTPRDLISDEDVRITMYGLCESIASRLRDHQYKCSLVQIYIRDNSLFSFQRQGSLLIPCCSSKSIFEKAFSLYQEHYDIRSDKPIRSIGVRACKLSDIDVIQLSMLPEMKTLQAQEDVEIAIDMIRSRYGYHQIQRGLMLKDEGLSALDAKSDNTIHPVSYFRKKVDQ